MGLRAAVEGAGESLPRRIVATHERGVSVVAVVGAAEISGGGVALRWRDGRRQAPALGEAAALLRRQARPGRARLPLAPQPG